MLVMYTVDELRELGSEIFDKLRNGKIELQRVPDQAALLFKSAETVEELVGLLLHGKYSTHAFQVAVLNSWRTAGASATEDEAVWEETREKFLAELIRLMHSTQVGPAH